MGPREPSVRPEESLTQEGRGSYLCDRVLHTFYICGPHLPPPRSCQGCRHGRTTRGLSPHSSLEERQQKEGGESSTRCGWLSHPVTGLMKRAQEPLALFISRTKNKRLKIEKDLSSRVFIAFQTMMWRNKDISSQAGNRCTRDEKSTVPAPKFKTLLCSSRFSVRFTFRTYG